jgi:hypothetical protein
MEKVVPLFKSFTTKFYFIFFELGMVLLDYSKLERIWTPLNHFKFWIGIKIVWPSPPAPCRGPHASLSPPPSHSSPISKPPRNPPPIGSRYRACSKRDRAPTVAPFFLLAPLLPHPYHAWHPHRSPSACCPCRCRKPPPSHQFWSRRAHWSPSLVNFSLHSYPSPIGRFPLALSTPWGCQSTLLSSSTTTAHRRATTTAERCRPKALLRLTDDRAQRWDFADLFMPGATPDKP